jgi:TonB family protein
MRSRVKPPRRAFLVALAVLLATARGAGGQKADDADKWISFSPAGEAFTALVPVRLAVKRQPAAAGVASPGGLLYAAKGRDSVAYLVWSLESPRAAGDQTSAISDHLDSCAELAWNMIVAPDEERARRNPRFRPEARYGMSYERDAHDGYFMREYRIKLNDQRGGAYVFTDGSRAYVAAAYGPAAGAANVAKFLDSFAVKLPGRDDSIKMPPRPNGDSPGALGTGSGSGAGVGGGQGGGGVGPGRGGNTGGGDRAATPQAERTPGAPCGSGDDRAFRPGELTRRATIFARPEPTYTEWARKFSVTGTVRVRAILKADGTVGSAAALTRLPHGLTRKALEAMRAIKFEPAEKDGCKVSQYVTVDYNFNIY